MATKLNVGIDEELVRQMISGQTLKCTPNIGRISICLDGMSSVLYRAHVV